jgi:hypothetical protein
MFSMILMRLLATAAAAPSPWDYACTQGLTEASWESHPVYKSGRKEGDTVEAAYKEAQAQLYDRLCGAGTTYSDVRCARIEPQITRWKKAWDPETRQACAVAAVRRSFLDQLGVEEREFSEKLDTVAEAIARAAEGQPVAIGATTWSNGDDAAAVGALVRGRLVAALGQREDLTLASEKTNAAAFHLELIPGVDQVLVSVAWASPTGGGGAPVRGFAIPIELLGLTDGDIERQRAASSQPPPLEVDVLLEADAMLAGFQPSPVETARGSISLPSCSRLRFQVRASEATNLVVAWYSDVTSTLQTLPIAGSIPGGATVTIPDSWIFLDEVVGAEELFLVFHRKPLDPAALAGLVDVQGASATSVLNSLSVPQGAETKLRAGDTILGQFKGLAVAFATTAPANRTRVVAPDGDVAVYHLSITHTASPMACPEEW